MGSGEDLAPSGPAAPPWAAPITTRQHPCLLPPSPCMGSPVCLWMKDELLAQLPPGRGTLPVHPPCFYSQIFQP